MRYAFVFLSIAIMWIAALLLAMFTKIDATLLLVVIIAMTLTLFIIGFRKGKG